MKKSIVILSILVILEFGNLSHAFDETLETTRNYEVSNSDETAIVDNDENKPNKKTVVLLIPLRNSEETVKLEEYEAEKTNEQTHHGHMTKRCKSLNPRRKSRRIVIPKDSQKYFSLSTESSIDADMNDENNEKSYFRLASMKDTKNILKSLLKSRSAKRENNDAIISKNFDEDPKVSSKQDFKKRPKKFVCYCIEDNCEPAKPKKKPSRPYAVKVPMAPNILTGNNYFANEESQQISNLLGSTQKVLGAPHNLYCPPGAVLMEESDYSDRKLRNPKRRPVKKCSPMIVPCPSEIRSLGQPTRINIPLAGNRKLDRRVYRVDRKLPFAQRLQSINEQNQPVEDAPCPETEKSLGEASNFEDYYNQQNSFNTYGQIPLSPNLVYPQPYVVYPGYPQYPRYSHGFVGKPQFPSKPVDEPCEEQQGTPYEATPLGRNFIDLEECMKLYGPNVCIVTTTMISSIDADHARNDEDEGSIISTHRDEDTYLTTERTLHRPTTVWAYPTKMYDTGNVAAILSHDEASDEDDDEESHRSTEEPLYGPTVTRAYPTKMYNTENLDATHSQEGESDEEDEETHHTTDESPESETTNWAYSTKMYNTGSSATTHFQNLASDEEHEKGDEENVQLPQDRITKMPQQYRGTAVERFPYLMGSDKIGPNNNTPRITTSGYGVINWKQNKPSDSIEHENFVDPDSPIRHSDPNNVEYLIPIADSDESRTEDYHEVSDELEENVTFDRLKNATVYPQLSTTRLPANWQGAHKISSPQYLEYTAPSVPVGKHTIHGSSGNDRETDQSSATSAKTVFVGMEEPWATSKEPLKESGFHDSKRVTTVYPVIDNEDRSLGTTSGIHSPDNRINGNSLPQSTNLHYSVQPEQPAANFASPVPETMDSHRQLFENSSVRPTKEDTKFGIVSNTRLDNDHQDSNSDWTMTNSGSGTTPSLGVLQSRQHTFPATYGTSNNADEGMASSWPQESEEDSVGQLQSVSKHQSTTSYIQNSPFEGSASAEDHSFGSEGSAEPKNKYNGMKTKDWYYTTISGSSIDEQTTSNKNAQNQYVGSYHSMPAEKFSTTSWSDVSHTENIHLLTTTEGIQETSQTTSKNNYYSSPSDRPFVIVNDHTTTEPENLELVSSTADANSSTEDSPNFKTQSILGDRLASETIGEILEVTPSENFVNSSGESGPLNNVPSQYKNGEKVGKPVEASLQPAATTSSFEDDIKEEYNGYFSSHSYDDKVEEVTGPDSYFEGGGLQNLNDFTSKTSDELSRNDNVESNHSTIVDEEVGDTNRPTPAITLGSNDSSKEIPQTGNYGTVNHLRADVDASTPISTVRYFGEPSTNSNILGSDNAGRDGVFISDAQSPTQGSHPVESLRKAEPTFGEANESDLTTRTSDLEESTSYKLLQSPLRTTTTTEKQAKEAASNAEYMKQGHIPKVTASSEQTTSSYDQVGDAQKAMTAHEDNDEYTSGSTENENKLQSDEYMYTNDYTSTENLGVTEYSQYPYDSKSQQQDSTNFAHDSTLNYAGTLYPHSATTTEHPDSFSSFGTAESASNTHEEYGAPTSTNQIVLQHPEFQTTSTNGYTKENWKPTDLADKDRKFLKSVIRKVIKDLVSPRDALKNKLGQSDRVGSPNEGLLPGLPILKKLFSLPEVKDMAVNTVKSLISEVTGTPPDSSLSRFKDHVIESVFSGVVNDLLPEETTSSTVDENQYKDGPRTVLPTSSAPSENIVGLSQAGGISRIIQNIIGRPGIGLEGAKSPIAQNIIVHAVQNALAKVKEAVDHSVIWDVMNDVMTRAENSGKQSKQPVLPLPKAPGGPMKHIPVIPVVEHVFKDGQWSEKRTVLGMTRQPPRSKLVTGATTTTRNDGQGSTSTTSSTSNTNELGYTTNTIDYALLGESDEIQDESTMKDVIKTTIENVGAPPSRNMGDDEDLEKAPIKYYSPQDRILNYIKNHQTTAGMRQTTSRTWNTDRTTGSSWSANESSGTNGLLKSAQDGVSDSDEVSTRSYENSSLDSTAKSKTCKCVDEVATNLTSSSEEATSVSPDSAEENYSDLPSSIYHLDGDDGADIEDTTDEYVGEEDPEMTLDSFREHAQEMSTESPQLSSTIYHLDVTAGDEYATEEYISNENVSTEEDAGRVGNTGLPDIQSTGNYLEENGDEEVSTEESSSSTSDTSNIKSGDGASSITASSGSDFTSDVSNQIFEAKNGQNIDQGASTSESIVHAADQVKMANVKESTTQTLHHKFTKLPKYYNPIQETTMLSPGLIGAAKSRGGSQSFQENMKSSSDQPHETRLSALQSTENYLEGNGDEAVSTKESSSSTADTLDVTSQILEARNEQNIYRGAPTSESTVRAADQVKMANADESTTQILDHDSVQQTTLTTGLVGAAESANQDFQQSINPSSNCVTPKWDPTYFGKISLNNVSPGVNRIADLEDTELFYVGDGVKIPLVIRKMADGSFALSISEKICDHFIKRKCPCCVPKEGEVVEERRQLNDPEEVEYDSSSKKNSDGSADSETTESSIFGSKSKKRYVRSTSGSDIIVTSASPVDSFAKKYNLTLNLQMDHDDSLIASALNTKEIIKTGRKKKLGFSRDTKISNLFMHDNQIQRDDSEEMTAINDDDSEMNAIRRSESNYDVENSFIRSLMNIKDIPEYKRAEVVVNALDGLMNLGATKNGSPISMVDLEDQSTLEDNSEYDLDDVENEMARYGYQKDNPILERIRYIKEQQNGRGQRYKYQRNIDRQAEGKMNVLKTVLHWLREVFLDAKVDKAKND